jgi:allophanate hydrolase
VTTWITRRPDAEVDAHLATVDRELALAGLRVAVKDNIDVAGLPTTVGCPGPGEVPERSAAVVERLVAAGAVVVGKTNLDQLATGLVGTRSPYGVCESPVAPGRVSGGSSSGSAVAVALGEVELALGTDTAGSGRVPAALCGIVGLKPTPGWLSLRGVVPASPSYDCVSLFARDVETAATALEVAAGYDPLDPRSVTRPEVAGEAIARVGVPDPALVEATCAPELAAAFAQLVARLPGLGLEVDVVDLQPYLDAGALLYGPLLAERRAAVLPRLEGAGEGSDPTVRAIVEGAADITAGDLIAAQEQLVVLRHAAAAVWGAVGAVVVPTATGHPTLAEVAADPIGANAALGRWANGCNLVGWCAAAVPVGTWGDGLPFGVSVLGPAWTDRAVWTAAAVIAGQPAPAAPGRPSQALLEVAVCGAHLEGEPLHHQLADRRARLVARTTTAAAYRMSALATEPPKPGLVRVADGGAALEVEVWAMEPAAFGSFVDLVPAPLAIGTIELADGTWVNGFVCEPHALADAEDITACGGWRAWRNRANGPRRS